MKTKSLLILGTSLSALASLPGHSQTSSDGALEAQCRATEVTMPNSCPCTITKAREVGLNDSELASLFKDDGHAQPVDQGKYSQFWQVKSQCIADTMMASLGVSQGNPLPGVPAHMRPQMPGVMPPAPAAAPAPQAASTTPPPTGLVTPPSVATQTRPAPQVAPQVSSPPHASTASAASASVANGFTIAGLTPTRKVKTRENGEETIELKFALQGSDFYLSYSKSLEDHPGVLDRAFAMQSESLERAVKYDEPSNRSYRDEEHTFWGAGVGLGRLSPIIASGYTNNRPAGQFLYSSLFDTDLGREIEWSDVFDTRVWNGAMREHYCAGLQAERLAKDTWEYSTFCPEFSSLAIEFKPQDDGSLKLSFAAYNGVAGSYAEGTYESQVPLTAALLSAVRPAYRDVFAGVTPSSELPLIKRAGRKHYPAPRYYDRDTVNLDFDYRWDGAQAQSGVDWELLERAKADYETVSARANEMVANGSRAPLKFGVLWTSGYGVGKLLVPMTKLILTGDDLTPSLLEPSIDDTILWDVKANKAINYEELFPRDWNSTIRKEFCDQIISILTMRELPQFSQCPSYDDTLISLMDGMEGNHVLIFSLRGEQAKAINSSVTVNVTKEMKARANPKYRDAIVPYIRYDDF